MYFYALQPVTNLLNYKRSLRASQLSNDFLEFSSCSPIPGIQRFRKSVHPAACLRLSVMTQSTSTAWFSPKSPSSLRIMHFTWKCHVSGRGGFNLSRISCLVHNFWLYPCLISTSATHILSEGRGILLCSALLFLTGGFLQGNPAEHRNPRSQPSTARVFGMLVPHTP